MTKEHIQLLIGRGGEGSALWINGDFKQTDAEVFRQNSGLMIAVDRLKGHPKFGYVTLLKTERSETAARADLLDCYEEADNPDNMDDSIEDLLEAWLSY
jgi:PhoH-like ATPase